MKDWLNMDVLKMLWHGAARLPGIAGAQMGMHESRKRWQPEPGVGKGTQWEKDGTCPSRAMYGEHWDKKDHSWAGVGRD